MDEANGFFDGYKKKDHTQKKLAVGYSPSPSHFCVYFYLFFFSPSLHSTTSPRAHVVTAAIILISTRHRRDAISMKYEDVSELCRH
jgi:hypothetical protein